MSRMVTVPGPFGSIPGLHVSPTTPRATVILRYGLRGRMEVQRREAERLAGAGYATLVPEAPHHGLRDDGLLDRLSALPESAARALFLDVVERTAAETTALVDWAVKQGAHRVVVAGISFGGYVALAGPSRDPRVEAVVAFQADPRWDARPTSPHLDLDAWRRCSLFAVTSADDVQVPPAPLRDFTRALAARASAFPRRYVHREYPGGHMMDATDWDDAWSHATVWLDEALAWRG